MSASGHTVQKFVFDRSLGGPATRDANAPMAMPASLSDAADSSADIEALCRDAHAEGFAEGIEKGRSEGRRDAESELANQARAMAENLLAERLTERDETALERIAATLPAMFERVDSARLHCERRAVETALGLIRRLTPRLLSQAAEEQCAQLLRDAVLAAAASPRLDIHVPPAMAAAVEGRLNALSAQHGYAGRLTVTPDADLSHGAIQARWDGGGADWDPKALRQRIDDTAALILCRLNGDDPAPQGLSPDKE